MLFVNFHKFWKSSILLLLRLFHPLFIRSGSVKSSWVLFYRMSLRFFRSFYKLNIQIILLSSTRIFPIYLHQWSKSHQQVERWQILFSLFVFYPSSRNFTTTEALKETETSHLLPIFHDKLHPIVNLLMVTGDSGSTHSLAWISHEHSYKTEATTAHHH